MTPLHPPLGPHIVWQKAEVIFLDGCMLERSGTSSQPFKHKDTPAPMRGKQEPFTPRALVVCCAATAGREVGSCALTTALCAALNPKP